MIRIKHVWFLGFALLATAASGQVWIEFDDAPDGVPGNQSTTGSGALLEIHGSLNGPQGDHVDTYCITIVDPMQFYASTSNHLGGSLSPTDLLADSRMWLWTQSLTDGTSEMRLANDNDAFTPGDRASTLASPSLFPQLTGGEVHPTAQGITLDANEQYLLSISTFPNDPEDVNNIALAPMDEPGFVDTSLYGPDPNAGLFHHWENEPSTESGPYIVALRGASFCLIPEPTSAVSIFFGVAFLARFCRVDARSQTRP